MQSTTPTCWLIILINRCHIVFLHVKNCSYVNYVLSTLFCLLLTKPVPAFYIEIKSHSLSAITINCMFQGKYPFLGRINSIKTKSWKISSFVVNFLFSISHFLTYSCLPEFVACQRYHCHAKGIKSELGGLCFIYIFSRCIFNKFFLLFLNVKCAYADLYVQHSPT